MRVDVANSARRDEGANADATTDHPMTTSPPDPSDDHRARRVGYRLDWCASVALILDNRPDLSVIAAVDVMGGIYPNPFASLGAYRTFASTNSDEVKRRKAEIWQHLEHVEKSARSSGGVGPDEEAELIAVVGIRIAERFIGLGMTDTPTGRPPEPRASDDDHSARRPTFNPRA
jgi:hypothetical protein